MNDKLSLSDWINDPKERQLLATKLHKKYQKDKLKKEIVDSHAELEKIDDLWRAACEQGKFTGRVSLCWLDLKKISQRIYTYPQDYNVDLQQLILDGMGLSSFDQIPERCSNLKLLSLASNSIHDIGDIHKLTRLTSLNLLRNQLSHLPPSIGGLINLTRLDIANNELIELPAEISKLSGLRKLNLECNALSDLPSSFGRLSCEVINLNSNKFSVCPTCITNLKNLRSFSIMGNDLGSLPSGLFKLKVLEIFRASRNRIMVLPDSIVDITSLRCLWLDHNKISALPPNFHRLQRLKELKLEGNIDMVYPPLEIVEKGTVEVLRWSRIRCDMEKSVKVRHMIQTLEEVFNQVKRYKIGGALHDSVFEVVDGKFQFPPNALWSIFLPELSKKWSDPNNKTNDGIKSFPFERHEVEQALFEFRDAMGPIIAATSHARFRRCSCVQTRGTSQVCIPPKIGWMCTRPALQMRMNVCYEKNMREKRRIRAELKQIADAEEVARKNADIFLASDEGRIFIREKSVMRKSEWSKKSITNRSNPLAISSHLSPISKISETISTKIYGIKVGRKTKLKQIEEELKEEYITEELTKSRNSIIQRNENMRKVMSNWMGLSLDEAFRGWQYCVKRENKQRRREYRAQLREERLCYEDNLAKYDFEQKELSKWDEKWDEFNDIPIWVHSITKELRLEKPPDPVHPLIPKSLINMNTQELLSQREILQNEADTTSEDSPGLEMNDNAGETIFHRSDNSRKYTSIPHGRAAECKIAQQRILQVQKLQVMRKYRNQHK